MAAGSFYTQAFAGVAAKDIALQPLPPASLTVQLVVRNETRSGIEPRLQRMRKMGVCMAVSSYPGAQVHGGNALAPDASAANYYFEYERKKRIDTANARISFVVQPQHGQIIQKPNDTLYYYKPTEGYQGKDRVEALVEGDGYKVRVVYDILSGLSDVDIGNEESWRLCPKGLIWKISQSNFAPNTQDTTAWLRSLQHPSQIASATPRHTGAIFGPISP